MSKNKKIQPQPKAKSQIKTSTQRTLAEKAGVRALLVDNLLRSCSVPAFATRAQKVPHFLLPEEALEAFTTLVKDQACSRLEFLRDALNAQQSEASTIASTSHTVLLPLLTTDIEKEALQEQAYLGIWDLRPKEQDSGAVAFQ